MSVVRLGDVCQQARESVKPGERPELRYIGLETIESGSGMFVEGELSKTPETPMANSFKFGPEHVLYGKLRPYLNKVALPTFEGKCSTEIIPLLPSADIDRSYLGYFLRSGHVVGLISARTAGARMPRADMDFIFSLPIPLPPLPEQRRIVDLLSRAESIVRLRREAEKKAAELTPALFLDMFGDPATNPKGWQQIRVSDSKSRVQIGPFGSLLHKEDYVSGGVPLINPMHIIKGRIAPGSEQTVKEEKAAELSNYRLEAGDVVMGRRGEMGRCAIVSPTEARMLCGTGSLFIRPAPEEFSPVFLSALLSSTQMKQHLESLSQGVTLANLNRSMIEGLQLLLPPMDLQRTFAERVQEAESIQSQQSTATTKAQATFDALLSQAFSSEAHAA